jgi:tagaturonate epimerase
MLITELTQSLVTLSEKEQIDLAARIGAAIHARVYPRSMVSLFDFLYLLANEDGEKRLLILGPAQPEGVPETATSQPVEMDGQSLALVSCPMSPATAIYLRQQFDWLRPRILGLSKSAGCGDRLGLATPGHIRAVRECKTGIAPIFAQQSIREMARAQRTPQHVIDDAMWGVFQEGWRSGYGADADHLKTFEDIDRCVAAGYTFYTFDPGAYVENKFSPSKFDAFPWPDLETTAADVTARYKSLYETDTIQHALVKYGRAIAHVCRLYRYLHSAMVGRAFEVEVSVDETDQPTSFAEHYIIAGELRRLGVEWVSLAPRFVGRFEKGVDYIGDLDAFREDCAGHVQLAKHWGPYKLSIHSGSDKFSIYPIVTELAGNMVHLKTAGTSYLEALRTVARCDPKLFQQVYQLAHEKYAGDRASYHVSANPARAPRKDLLGVEDLQDILNQFDARQMLHVCFGSILSKYGKEIKSVLAQNEETHYADLQRHFARHLESFCN